MYWGGKNPFYFFNLKKWDYTSPKSSNTVTITSSQALKKLDESFVWYIPRVHYLNHEIHWPRLKKPWLLGSISNQGKHPCLLISHKLIIEQSNTQSEANAAQSTPLKQTDWQVFLVEFRRQNSELNYLPRIHKEKRRDLMFQNTQHREHFFLFTNRTVTCIHRSGALVASINKIIHKPIHFNNKLFDAREKNLKYWHVLEFKHPRNKVNTMSLIERTHFQQ